MFSQVAAEAFDIQADLFGITQQVCFAELVLVLKQSGMHLPKFPLITSCLSRLCGELGLGVDAVKREMAVNVEDFILQAFAQGVDNFVGAAAKLALVIAVFHQGYARLRRAKLVIPCGYG